MEYIVTCNQERMYATEHLREATTTAKALAAQRHQLDPRFFTGRWPNQTIRLMERERPSIWFTTIKTWPGTE